MTRAPIATLALIACMLACFCVPALHETLIFDRGAIAHGEAWRLASGNLVHFSATHLTANLLVLAVAGALLERHSPRATLALYALSALSTGCVLLALEPALARFGGASGIASAAVTLLALQWLEEGGRRRAVGAGLLALLATKLLLEFGTGRSMVAGNAPGFVLVPASHAAGIAAAALLFSIRSLTLMRRTSSHRPELLRRSEAP